MRQVYDMFSGRLQPADVLAAAQAGKPAPDLLSRQLFYAHLYVGIHYDLEGNVPKAVEHLEKAAGEYRIGHYMGDVARIHRDILKKKS
jgi:lipoprotein NlpI